MRAYFISDIHIKRMDEPNAEVLLNFLDLVAADSEATHLFWVGDIFDFWMADHDYFAEKFKPIVDKCQNLIRRGLRFHVFEGNHDMNLKRFWQLKMGGQVHSDATYFQLGEHSVRVEHGDLIDKKDKGYQRLRWFLRTPFILWASQAVPGFVVSSIGDNWSAASRKHGQKHAKDTSEEICEKIHYHAQESIKEKYFDFIISGHVHVRDYFTFDWQDKKVTSVNLGTWLTHPSYFVLDQKGGRFVDLELP